MPLRMVERPYLVDGHTRKRLAVGDTVRTFNGTYGLLTAIQIPHKPESTGRVYVLLDGSSEPAAFFPGVIGAVWVGRTDGGASGE